MINPAASSPAVLGLPLLLLRLEGGAVLAAAVLGYAASGGSWVLFSALFLLPDLAMAGYLRGSAFGALAYNLAHSHLAPAVVAAVGLALGAEGAIIVALVWSAHIGFDRALGYGLRYPEGFAATHLGRLATEQRHRPRGSADG